MRYIKSYNESLSNNEIEYWCRKYGINNYTINGDGSIDVAGDVHLVSRGIVKLPIKFNKVAGDFDCSSNLLTSLEGTPQKVGGSFICNKIAQLLNEYDVISQDGKKIYRDNLEEVFHVLGKEIPEDLKFDNYEIH